MNKRVVVELDAETGQFSIQHCELLEVSTWIELCRALSTVQGEIANSSLQEV